MEHVSIIGSERDEESQVHDDSRTLTAHGEPIVIGLLNQLREALASAENDDFGQMLTAFARVLTYGESELPDDQLYAVERHKVRGGWRASVRFASGQQITGGVRASQSAAVEDAHEESFRFLGDFIRKLAEASARRVGGANHGKNPHRRVDAGGPR